MPLLHLPENRCDAWSRLVTNEEEARRGQLAHDALTNPVYVEAHEAIDAEIVRLWRDSKDTNEREQLHHLLKVHAKAKAIMEQVMRSGEIAQAKIAEKKSRLSRIGQTFTRR
jgi:hypothetical protein